MTARAAAHFQPRKTPVQRRAAVTVDAISEATIQILLKQGANQLTTTRVADRAGVSVGTLYQYYPNKQSLLFAVLGAHLDGIASAIEAACDAARGRPTREIIKAVVEAFVDAKMRRMDVSAALYRFAMDSGAPALAKMLGQRSRKALTEALRTAPDLKSPPDPFAIEMMFAAMAGCTRSVLEAGAPPAAMRQLREHLVVLCQSYIRAQHVSR